MQTKSGLAYLAKGKGQVISRGRDIGRELGEPSFDAELEAGRDAFEVDSDRACHGLGVVVPKFELVIENRVRLRDEEVQVLANLAASSGE